MRPKSSATVVVAFDSTPDRSSTPSLLSLISSSVDIGAISLTEPTMVVLPTPNPPAMRIFADVIFGGAMVSESEKAITYRPYQIGGLAVVVFGGMPRLVRADGQITVRDEIT